MRRLMSFLVVLALAVPLSAQVHEATPLGVLLDRLGVSHDHHDMAAMAGMQPEALTVAAAAVAAPAASTKTFNVTARQFEFDFSPSPFVVNVGDDVTLNISVPSSDAAPNGHSFFLETFMTDAVPIANGHTITIHFVATTPGTFTYLCLQSSCGIGHTSMNGTLTVNAAPAGPTVTSISPASAPVTGATQVTIKGSGFASGATVRIGPTTLTNVTVVDASTITARTSAVAPNEEIGLALDVVVTNPDGSSATLPAAFTYTLPPLSLSAVQPDGGPPAGGTTVTILGNGFTNAVRMDVTFGGVPATNVAVVSSTVMTVTAPPHASGSVDVVVSFGSATGKIVNGFTYGNAPPKRRSARK